MKTLSIGEATQNAGLFLKREAGLAVPVALLFIGIPLALLLLSVPPSLRRSMASPDPSAQVAMPFQAVVMLFVCMVLATVGSLALYIMALRPGISVGEAIRHGFRRMPVALVATMLLGMVLFVLLVLLSGMPMPVATLGLMAGGLLISSRMLLLNARVADRPVRAIAALRESWELTKGNMLRVLAYVAVMTFPVMVMQLVGQSLFGMIGYALGGAEGARQAGDVGAAFALSLGQMVMIIINSYIYRQLTAGRGQKIRAD